LTWFSRTGSQLGTLGPSGYYNHARLSRDGRLVAFDRGGAAGQGTDILTLDIDRGGLISKVVSLAGADFSPVLSPEGDRIVFGSSREPATNAGAFNPSAGHLYTKTLATIGDGEILLRRGGGKTTTDWSRDGRYVAYTMDNDVWALPMTQSTGAEPVQVTNTPFAESAAVFSPIDRWIAYQSSDSTAGQDVYVQAFPNGIRRQVSVGGGSTPRWRHDGSELFYVSPDLELMAVPITRNGGGLTIGKPVRLFQSRAFQGNPGYDVTADDRFLVAVPLSAPQDNSVAVIVNWPATLKP